MALASIGELMDKLTLHEDPRSRNCYKVRLTAAMLGLPLERRAYDVIAGDTRSPEFLRDVNAMGRIPVLQIADRFLPDGNAACWYMAEGTKLLPKDRFDRADVLRWMAFEQCNHEPNVAILRFWLLYVGERNLSQFQRDQIPAKRVAGDTALATMNDHLSGRDWLVGARVSLADIILYAYTHVCEAGGFRLRDYPALCGWIARIEALDGYEPMA